METTRLAGLNRTAHSFKANADFTHTTQNIYFLVSFVILKHYLKTLTNHAPFGSNAIIEAEVGYLAVTVFYVQLSKVKVDPAAAGDADFPLAHGVVWVRPRVTQRGQSPADWPQDTGATAITCRDTHADEVHSAS